MKWWSLEYEYRKCMSFGAEGLALAQLEVHYLLQSSQSFGPFYISLIQHVFNVLFAESINKQ